MQNAARLLKGGAEKGEKRKAESEKWKAEGKGEEQCKYIPESKGEND